MGARRARPTCGAAAAAFAAVIAVVLLVTAGRIGSPSAAAAPVQTPSTSAAEDPGAPSIDVVPARRPAQLLVVGAGANLLTLLDDAGATVGVVPADTADGAVEVDLCRDGRHLVETAPDEVRVRDLASLVVTTRFDRLPLSGAYRCLDSTGTRLVTTGPAAVFAVGTSNASVDVGAPIDDVLGVASDGSVLVATTTAVLAVDLNAGTATTRWTIDPNNVAPTDDALPATATRSLSPDGRRLLVASAAAVPTDDGRSASELHVLDASTGAVVTSSGLDAEPGPPNAPRVAGSAAWVDAARIADPRFSADATEVAILDATDLATLATVQGEAGAPVGTPSMTNDVVALAGFSVVWLPLDGDPATVGAVVDGATQLLALPDPVTVTAPLPDLAGQAPPTSRPFGQPGRGIRFDLDTDEPPIAAVPGLALTVLALFSLVLLSTVVRHRARDRHRARIASGSG